MVVWLLLIGLVVLPTAGSGLVPTPPTSTPSRSPGRAAVRIFDFRFQPAEVTVAAGTTVVWTMGPDPEQHTVTPDPDTPFPASPILDPGDPGDRWEVTFDVPGRYGYFCSLHSNMTGAVLVVAAPQASPPASPSPEAASTPLDVGGATGAPGAATVGPTAPDDAEVAPAIPPATRSPDLSAPMIVIGAVLAAMLLLGALLWRRRRYG